MAIRQAYALGQSPLNKFLFASIGKEKNGMDLTVLSALARLDFEPWTEAARLSGLTKEAATTALAAIISTLPEGNWSSATVRSIAVRLIKCLPKPSVSLASIPQVDVPDAQALGVKVRQGLILVGIGIAMFFVISRVMAPSAPEIHTGSIDRERPHVASVASADTIETLHPL